MADIKQTQKKILSRCGERVVFARLVGGETAYLFGGGGGIIRAKGVQRDGKEVTEMALHPWGLAIVPEVGPFKGRRLILPSAQVAFAEVSEDES